MPLAAQAAAQAATGSTESMAVASLVMGIGGLVICPVIGSILGIVFGLIARRRLERDPTKGGRGLATGGIVTGALGVLIVPILVAIAIPTFIGARDRAQDIVAESSLNRALQTAVGIANRTRTYTAVNDQSLAASGSGLTWIANGESGGPNIVSYMVVDDTEIRLAVLSASGKCFGVRDDSGGAGVGYASHEPGRLCNAGAFAPEEYGQRESPLTET